MFILHFRLFYAYKFFMNMVPKVHWDLTNMWKKFWKFLKKFDDLLRKLLNLLLKYASQDHIVLNARHWIFSDKSEREDFTLQALFFLKNIAPTLVIYVLCVWSHCWTFTRQILSQKIAKVCSAHCSTGRLALGSPGWVSFVTMPKIPLYDVLDHTNHTFSESSRSKDI